MPLQDHFHPPLAPNRSWTAFSNAWATYVAAALNQRLPEGYYAEPTAQFAIEIDVATWEEPGGPPRQQPPPDLGWEPTAPSLTLPLTIVTDLVEVKVFRNEGGPVLAGAVEFVSPGNKDRPAARDAFVSKCAAYLQGGVGLLLVDIVTERRADLHRDLLARVTPEKVPAPLGDLYAVSYRPVSHDKQPALEIWPESLALGAPLPTLPLWFRGGFCLPVELEATYEETRQKLRIAANGA